VTTDSKRSLLSPAAVLSVVSLALHVAHQVAGTFPDGRLYVNLRGSDPAGTPVTPAAAIRVFLDALAVPARDIPADLDAQAALYHRLLAGKRMLVLLDNAHDDQVRPLLPAGPGCLVIVTSRQRLASLIAEGAQLLTLDVLASGEARDLLARHLGPERLAGDPRAVADLIELCARLPLALSIAAALAASQPGLSLTALAERLRDARGRLDVLDAVPTTANVRPAFSCSYQQLDPDTARLFRLLGLRPGPDISAAAAVSLAGLPPAEGRRVLGELTRAHLLDEHAARYSCHDLLRAYAAELARQADSEAEQRAATSRILDHYMHTAAAAALRLHPRRKPVTLGVLRPGVTLERIDDAKQALAWFQAECPVLLAAVARAADDGFDTHAWQITWALSRFLDVQGRWDDWAAIEQIALAATQRLDDRAAQAASHQRLGHASSRLGNYADAHAHLELALAIHTERGDRAGQAYVHNSLAIALNSQGRYREALGRAEQALESYTAAGDLPGKALALNSIGWFHAVLGDHQQALSYCGQALDLFGELGHREGVANALDSLGYAHQRLGNYTGATACYEQALGLHRELGSRWGAAETLGHLGDTKDAAGHPAEARAAWAEALTILEDLRHPAAGRIREKLVVASSSLSPLGSPRERHSRARDFRPWHRDLCQLTGSTRRS
jgi:tetratricopeptide (TPR) repeat protein